eukprot:gene9500-12798_t
MLALKRNITTLLICSTVFFLFADQNLLAPNLSQIAQEFGFDDHQRDEKLGGNIALGFFLVGAPIALIVGYYADITHRCHLFGVVVILGELSCLGTYWTSTYWELFFCRVLTGISIGGATPIIFSLFGDLYPGTSRTLVNSFVGLALSAGIAFGQFISGFIGPVYGWRLPFLLISIPAIICGLLVIIFGREPKRGEQEEVIKSISTIIHNKEIFNRNHTCEEHQLFQLIHDNNNNFIKQGKSSSSFRELNDEETKSIESLSPIDRKSENKDQVKGTADKELLLDTIHTQFIASNTVCNSAEESDVPYTEKIEWKKLGQIIQTKSVIIILLQGIPGCLPWGMIFTFLNDFFSNEGKMSVQQATMTLTMFAVGGLFGQLLGGWVGQVLYNRDKRLQPLLMGLSTLLGIPPVLYMLNAGSTHSSLGGFYFLSFLSGFIICINGPNVRAILQNVCLPEVRGTAFAVFTLTDDVGKGLGPAFVVLFIKAFNGNRRVAFSIITLFWIICGFMLLSLTWTITYDENVVQESIRSSVMTQQMLFSLNSSTMIEESLESIENKLIEKFDGNQIMFDPSPIMTKHKINNNKYGWYDLNNNINSSTTTTPLHQPRTPPVETSYQNPIYNNNNSNQTNDLLIEPNNFVEYDINA